ncbi:MAG: branched-chain amino acid ABC transporter permease [Azospirillaceae bacterium]
MIEILPQYLFNGVLVGANYALIALGLTVIFGLMNIANFAHGQFYMMGGFMAYVLTASLGIGYFPAIVIAVLVVAAAGVVLDRLIFFRLRAKPLISSVLVTIGLSILLENLALLLWGPKPEAIPSPFSKMPVVLGPIFASEARLFALGVTFATIAAVHVALRYTRWGKAVRATFQQPEAAALSGIDVDRLYAACFGIGAGLAALGGALLGSIFFVHPTMGGIATLKAFIVVILGGMGSFPGAIAGGLLLGISESLGTLVSSAYKDAIGFILVILILLYRPDGLFRRA